MSDEQDVQPAAAPDEALPAPLQQLRDQFGDKLLEVKLSERDWDFTVAPEALADFVAELRRALPPEHAFCDACGVEHDESIEAVYRFSLVREPRRIVVRARAPKSHPVLPTLSHLYKGALWPERELAEMFGVTFESHPDLRHLLLPGDWKGHPLRKDYAYPLDHPYLAPDPLREDPATVLCPPKPAAEAQAGEEGAPLG